MTTRRFAALSGTALLTLALTACGGDDLSTYNSGSDLMDDALATGLLNCDSRVYGPGEAKTVDELDSGEESLDICLHESLSHYSATVQNDMSGEESAANEWEDYDGTTGVAAGANWYFDCLDFEDISKSQCEDLAGELGGKLIVFGE